MRAAIASRLRFFTQKEDAHGMALCRIGVGLTLGLHALHLYTSGTAQFALSHASWGGLGAHHGALRVLGGATPENVQGLLLILALSGFLVAVGLVTRGSIFAAWTLLQMLSALNPVAQGDYDRVLTQSLFVLFWSGCERAWSLDRVLDRKLRGQGTETYRWPRVWMMIHLALLYLGTALAKVSLSWLPWGDADALWNLLHHPLWTRGDHFQAPLFLFECTRWLTVAVWCWEFSWIIWFALVWWPFDRDAVTAPPLERRRRLRTGMVGMYLGFGLAFHLCTELVLEVGPFSFAILALYFCALPPTTWRALVARGRARA